MEKQKKKQMNEIDKISKNNTTKQKGITLIALVISIIVMLILAGVSLNMSIGENGIITKAQEAKIAQEEAELKEKIDMILAEAVGIDFDSKEDYIKWVNNKFKEQGLSANLQEDEQGYALIYGINRKKIEYIDESLKKIGSIEVVEGNSSYWTYRVDSATNKAILTGFNYDKLGRSITIPNLIDGYLISELGDQVFMFRTNLESVTFSNGLTRIGAKAFSGCTNLTTIGSFPTTLKTIGEEAFYGCSKMNLSLTFNDEIHEIGARAFYNCANITGAVTNLIRTDVTYGINVFSGCRKITGDISEAMSVLISNTDTKIPDNLFSGMSGLTGKVTIGSNIEEIGKYAFDNCSNITALDISIATSLKKIDDYAFSETRKLTSNVNFTNKLEYIGDLAFHQSAIKEVVLPSSLTYVGARAFWNSGLEKVIINCGDVIYNMPQGYTSCGIFSYCDKLESVVFGNECTITSIVNWCFSNCSSLESINLPNTVKTIGYAAFSGCSQLQDINYPSNLESIGIAAFKQTIIKKLPIAVVDGKTRLISSLTGIGGEAFYGNFELGYNNLTENHTTNIIELLGKSNVTSIGEHAFENSNYLVGVIDGENGLTNGFSDKISLGTSVFNSNYVKFGKEFKTKDDDGNAITLIAANEYKGVTTFFNSSKEEITEIVIPEGVTSIGQNAFDSCTSITKVTFPTTLQTIGTSAFQSCTQLTTVVNNSSNLTKIPDRCFYNCKLTDFPFEGIVNIGNNAFQGCRSLVSIDLPSTIETIGRIAFGHCEGLESIDISKTKVKKIENLVFSYCTKLEEIILNERIESFEGSCFFKCVALKEITIPASVNSIEYMAFYNCTALNDVYGCSNVGKIGEQCFEGCTNLKLIEGCSKVTVAERNAFRNCSSLTNISLNWSSLTSIQSKAFYNCSALKGTVTLESECDIESDAFYNCGLTVNVGY